MLITAEQARWVREQRTVLAELADGEIVVEITFKGLEFLVREVLKEAGDAVVLEPADAREAVLAAAEGPDRPRHMSSRPGGRGRRSRWSERGGDCAFLERGAGR